MPTYKRRGNGKKTYKPKSCEQCGESFLPKVAHQRFCRSYCRQAAWFFKQYIVPVPEEDK